MTWPRTPGPSLRPLMKSIRLEIVAPNRMVYSGDVTSVVVPAAYGLMGVLPGHAPLLAMLTAGKVTARPVPQPSTPDPAPVHFSVAGGFAEVLSDRVTVLADEATPAG